jgi:MerR family copper efflux transcriptional regulator
VLRLQIGRLEEKQAALDTALTFLRDKLSWVEAGKPGQSPEPGAYFC